MTLNEAIENVKKVCQMYVGTYADHMALQESLRLIEAALKAVAKPETE